MTELHRLRRPAAEGAGAVRARERGQEGPNDGSATTRPGGQTLAPYVNGLQIEYFEQAGSDYKLYNIDPTDWHGYWLGWLGLVDVAQNAGVDFYGGMRGDATETGKMMYGKASFLLEWNGKGGGFFWQMQRRLRRSLEPGLDDLTSAPRPPPATRSASAGAATTAPAPCSSTPAPPAPRPSTSAPATPPPAGPDVTTVTLQPTTAMILTGSATRRPTAPASTSAPALRSRGTDRPSHPGAERGRLEQRRCHCQLHSERRLGRSRLLHQRPARDERDHRYARERKLHRRRRGHESPDQRDGKARQDCAADHDRCRPAESNQFDERDPCFRRERSCPLRVPP